MAAHRFLRLSASVRTRFFCTAIFVKIDKVYQKVIFVKPQMGTYKHSKKPQN